MFHQKKSSNSFQSTCNTKPSPGSSPPLTICRPHPCGQSTMRLLHSFSSWDRRTFAQNSDRKYNPHPNSQGNIRFGHFSSQCSLISHNCIHSPHPQVHNWYRSAFRSTANSANSSMLYRFFSDFFHFNPNRFCFCFTFFR